MRLARSCRTSTCCWWTPRGPTWTSRTSSTSSPTSRQQADHERRQPSVRLLQPCKGCCGRYRAVVTAVDSSAPEVLVVEDDDTLSEVVVSYLARAGLRPTRVGDGIEALVQARQNPPDLVLLDLM